jgi:hypothetical protein
MKLWLPLVALAAVHATPAAGQQVSKAEKTPDFCQTDKQGNFHDGGRNFCGPVAVSNSLVWLAGQGYPELVDASVDSKKSQIELIRTLASTDYMQTADRDGTGPQRVMEGIYHYVTQRGYEFERLEFRGWIPVPRQYNPDKSRATREAIDEAMAHPRGIAVVNIGWYTHDRATDTYTRHGGHWMTVTGAGINAEGQGDKEAVLLHDPSPRSGRSKATHHSRLVPLSSGQLTGSKRGLPTTAEGVYEVRGGIAAKQVVEGEPTHPLVDGVVVAVLRKES